MKKEKNKGKMKARRIGLLTRIVGYFSLEMQRASCDSFLNLCLRYGFTYYDIIFDEENKTFIAIMPLYVRKNVLTACRMWQIRARVKEYFGLPKILARYRGRWGIAVGAILSVALFFAAQSVIWRIDVIGNERLTSEQIIESLADNGLSIGDVIDDIHTDSIEQRVMINDDDIAWISINIVGTVARVEVREVIDTEIKEKDTRPANLVAMYDGQIVSLEVYAGFPTVKEGDFVRAGEMLVSGIYNSEKAPLRYTRASGRIIARVSHTISVEIPLEQVKKVPTGEKIEYKTLIFFGKSIKLFTNYRNLPPTCDIMNYEYAFDPFSLGEMPISLRVDTFLPYVEQSVVISEEEAIEQAYQLLRERIDSELPGAQILRKRLLGEMVDGRYVLTCHITALCDIARTVEFDVLK